MRAVRGAARGAGVAEAAVESGAGILSRRNTFLAMAIEVETRRRKLSNVLGGLSGPAIRPIAARIVYECARCVTIPVIGGFGGGPWLDGRVRLAHTAIGYGEKWLDAKTETYANVAKLSLDAFTALIADVRAGRQIKG